MTPQEYDSYIKKKSQEADELLFGARALTRSLFNEQRYTEYLSLLSRFHRYSFLNVLLIQDQFSQATYLSGFETWKTVSMDTYNDPAYQILQQQYIGKGIKILVPFTVAAPDGKRNERKLIHFPVSVYDVHQTNRLIPPESDPLTLEVVDDYLMKALRSNTPYRFVLADKTNRIIQANIHSYFDNVNQFIVIDSSLSESERILEYIRAWIKKEVFDFIKHKNVSEVFSGFATSSSEYVVRTALGLKTKGIAFGYVSQYASVDLDELWLVLHCIQTISHAIIERLTDDILDMKDMAINDWLDGETLFDYQMMEGDEP